jgi:farnesyl-diphosphate farnesyltransferase
MNTRSPNVRQLLRGVSRSIGLSIRLLPAAVREPVGLAYLLARATDTVADTSGVPVARRLALLDSLQHALSQPQDHAQLQRALHDFARHVPDPHEQALLRQSQACLEALAQLPAADQAVILQVLSAITEGQAWDLRALDTSGHGVPTRQALDRYTWLVAGSVGEFWTRICELHLQDWHTGSSAELLQRGAAYGKGLQRLNILRDAGKDLRAGRCYWPAEELEPLGLDSARLCEAARSHDMTTLEQLRPLFEAWLCTTQEQLHDGLRYCLALRGRRLRLASALPCLIGIRTLALLRAAGPRALVDHIKLPRREVQQLLLTLVLTGVSDRQLLACWRAALPPTPASPVSARIAP